jgi:UDP-N-acetylmuramate-alanine ligase
LPGDLIVTLGAGDVYKIGEGVLAQLGQEPKVYERA